MKSKIVNIKGIAPLIMANDQGVDLFHPLTVQIRAITSKGTRNRTEQDEKRLRWLEWQSRLYWSDRLKGPFVPVDALEASIKMGAQLFRKGTEFKRAFMIECDGDMEIPLVYEPHYDSKERMFNDPGFVDTRPIGQQKKVRILRTRPIFLNWQLQKVKCVYDDNRLKDEDIVRALENAGKYCGLLDYRPRYGRFVIS